MPISRRPTDRSVEPTRRPLPPFENHGLLRRAEPFQNAELFQNAEPFQSAELFQNAEPFQSAELFQSFDWQLDGACADADATLFFHPEGEGGPAGHERDRAALALCAACPVIQACREHALSVPEPYGVWGGLSEVDREAINRPRRRPYRLTHRPVPAGALTCPPGLPVGGRFVPIYRGDSSGSMEH